MGDMGRISLALVVRVIEAGCREEEGAATVRECEVVVNVVVVVVVVVVAVVVIVDILLVVATRTTQAQEATPHTNESSVGCNREMTLVRVST